MPTLDHFQSLTSLANRLAFEELGYRHSCIMTSYALADVLRGQGFDASPIRIEASVHPDAGHHKYVGTILGFAGDGTRQRAAEPGMWRGHLAVAIGRDWLCDPTLDQANKPEWPVQVSPMAVALPPQFWRPCKHNGNGDGLLFVNLPNLEVRFMNYPRQTGFRHAADARPSHWRPLATAIRKHLGMTQ